MRWILAVILSLVLSTTVFGAGAIVQCKTGQASAITATNLSFNSLPAVGSKVKIIAIEYIVGGDNVTHDIVTDNQSGNSYVYEIQEALANGNTRAEIYAGYVVGSAGTFTVTLTNFNGLSYYTQWAICEVSGLDAVSSLDKTGHNSSASSPLVVTASGANAQADEVVFSTGVGVGTTSPTPTTGYTAIFNDTTLIGGSAGYKVISGAETSTATWTDATITDSGGVLTTDKAAASASEPDGEMMTMGVGK